MARSIVRGLMAGLPSGSFLALYEGVEFISQEFSDAQQGYDDTGAIPYRIRGREEAGRYFDGLELVEPGFVRWGEWRPDLAQGGRGPDVPTLAGVARKP